MGYFFEDTNNMIFLGILYQNVEKISCLFINYKDVKIVQFRLIIPKKLEEPIIS